MHPVEYLKHWLENNHFKIWRTSSKTPRILGRRATSIAEQEEFKQLGEILVAEMAAAMKPQKPVLFHLLDRDEASAWVVWPARCYAVLLTRGLVENIQATCGQAARLLDSALKKSLPGNFLADLWGPLPRKEDHRTAFGELIAHIAFSFVVYHELAHAGIGHEGANNVPSAQGVHSAEDQPLLDSAEFLDECAAATADGNLSPGLWIKSQALEVDADINGLRYTRKGMEKQARRFERVEVSSADVVWKALLTSSENRNFVVCIGVTIGLLSLLPDFELEKLGKLDAATHPPIPARLLAVLHASRHFDDHGADEQNMVRAVLIGASLIDMIVSARIAIANGGASDETEAPDSILDRALERISLPEMLSLFDEIGGHMQALAAERARLERTISDYRRFPDWLCYAWY